MARKLLDSTNNESLDIAVSKINENFAELYAANAEFTDWSGVTVTATGLVTAGSVKLDTGTKTATATAGAATLSKSAGVVTSESLTTAAAAIYTLTLTNTAIAAADQVFVSVQNGTNTAGVPVVSTVVPAAGSVVIKILNAHAADAFNGTIKIAFAVLKN